MYDLFPFPSCFCSTNYDRLASRQSEAFEALWKCRHRLWWSFLYKIFPPPKGSYHKVLHGGFHMHDRKGHPLGAVSSLSTESFLLTLKRFISRREIPTVMYSDNATNYVGARNHLKELREFFANFDLSDHIKTFTSEISFQWKFITPRSPHWGGLWESAIRGAKKHLQCISGNAQLTFEALSTVIAQIEAILNSRQLCPISSHPNDFQVLTPGHFLIGRPLTSCLDHSVTNLLENRLACSQMQQYF